MCAFPENLSPNFVNKEKKWFFLDITGASLKNHYYIRDTYVFMGSIPKLIYIYYAVML